MVRSLDSVKKIVQMYFCKEKLRIMLESGEVAFPKVQKGFFYNYVLPVVNLSPSPSTSLDYLNLFFCVNASYIWLTYILE